MFEFHHRLRHHVVRGAVRHVASVDWLEHERKKSSMRSTKMTALDHFRSGSESATVGTFSLGFKNLTEVKPGTIFECRVQRGPQTSQVASKRWLRISEVTSCGITANWRARIVKFQGHFIFSFNIVYDSSCLILFSFRRDQTTASIVLKKPNFASW